jgi:multiple antibiotic resistance protein
MRFFISEFLKFFFLITPFFALSMFLALLPDVSEEVRRRTARRTVFAAWIISVAMFLFGQVIFKVLGIGVDAFRIGAGALLFLSAVSLMNPKVTASGHEEDDDVAVVPLAMPVVIGPATCGPLLVKGAEIANWSGRALMILAMTLALAALWAILRVGATIERHLGKKGIAILMRLTGLVLSALSAQMIMTGVRAFLIK